MYYIYNELPETLASKYPNCAVYDGTFVCGDSEETLGVDTTVLLIDVSALDIDTGDTPEEIEADSKITVSDEDAGTPLEDDKAEARRLARVAARKAARIEARVQARVEARVAARKAIRMTGAEGKLADLKRPEHPMIAMQVSQAQGKHLFKPVEEL